jgi:hypothetical protein
MTCGKIFFCYVIGSCLLLLWFLYDRDYRYYEDDLIHPNKVAIQYIFNAFQKKYFSNETRQLMNEVEKLNQHLQHRPRFPKSPQYRQSLQYGLNKMVQLEQSYPGVFDYSSERKTIDQELKLE